jgi:hypothetical protein
MRKTKTQTRSAAAGWILVALCAGLVGCAKGGDQGGEATSERSHTHEDGTTHADGAPHGEEGRASQAVVPAQTAEAVWGQIEVRRLALETAIREGKLEQVHDEAFAIRDLAVAWAERKAPAGGPGRAALDAKVGEIRAIAGKLDEYGDAGNLTGTEAEFTKLNAALAALESAAP